MLAAPHASLLICADEVVQPSDGAHQIDIPSRQIVIKPGRHPTTTERLITGNAPELRVLDWSEGRPATLLGASHGKRGDRGGGGEVQIVGSWDLDGGKDWDKCRGLEYHSDGHAVEQDGEGGGIGMAGRGGPFPWGDALVFEGWRGGAAALLQNVALVNHRSEESPYQPVGVLSVVGGEWELHECEVAVRAAPRLPRRERARPRSSPRAACSRGAHGARGGAGKRHRAYSPGADPARRRRARPRGRRLS